MEGVAVATIVAKNHLSLARVLADSFHAHHPRVPFFVLLADEVDGRFDPAREPFSLIRLSELAIPDPARFRFHHSQQELTYAATPYLLSHLLRSGFTRAAFLKQESLVVGDMSPVFALLESSSILLTPHLLGPLSGEGMIERELNILQSGVYNVGFLGVSESPAAREFLDWWGDRVYAHCRHDVPQGMHFEQRWLDLAPAFFECVRVIRDPGFNVGHWNLPERELDFDGDAFTVGGRLCRLVRFSGFDPEHPHNVTRYSARLTTANVGEATARLFSRYLSLLEEAGYHETKRWPYAHGRFDNGTPITDRARRIYRELGEEAARFGDPFETSHAGSYFRWLKRHAYDHPGVCGKAARLWRAARVGGARSVLRTLGEAGRRKLLSAAAQFEVDGKGAAAARSFARGPRAANVPHVFNNFEDARSSNVDSTEQLPTQGGAAATATEGLAVATIVAKNYLSLARVLADSFRAQHPGVPFFALLADEAEGYFDPAREPFSLIRLSDLALPDLTRLRFQYQLKQFASALKPRLLAHLLDGGFRRVVFLDPDILVLGELSALFSEVSAHSVVLTPHAVAPLAGAGRAARELNLLQAGVHNAGFVAVSDTPGAREFLDWWRHRLSAHCRFDVPQGMHYDQRWLDLAPVFFDGVHLLRDPSYNVAYWNLPERDARADGAGGLLVGGGPCRFFHFSGFDPERPHNVTRYSHPLTPDDLEAAAPLFRRYLSLLEAAGYHETKRWPYAFDRFDNGATVSERARRLYRDLGEEAEKFGDPLKTAHAGSYYRWLSRQPGVIHGASQVVRCLWGGARRRLRRRARANEVP